MTHFTNDKNIQKFPNRFRFLKNGTYTCRKEVVFHNLNFPPTTKNPKTYVIELIF